MIFNKFRDVTLLRNRRKMEQVFATTVKLSDVIKDMQKCLQCTICLHTITDPVKTICGHRFCRTCIQTVLQNKNAHCPLCNTAIQRRSISKDEHMVLYIDRVEKLIEAIQLDSGIDITCHLSRPRDTRESCSSSNTEYFRSDAETVKPSCSYIDPTLQEKQRPSQTSRKRRSRKESMKRNSKKKGEQKEGNSIMKYLSNCGISGIEPLASDESNDFPVAKTTVDKVHSWLEGLPKNEASIRSSKVAPMKSVECNNLDDTLPISTSQDCGDNEAESSDKNIEIVNEIINEQTNTRDSMSRRSSRISSRNKDEEETESTDRREGSRKFSKTRGGKNFQPRMDFDTEMENPKASTSEITKSRDGSKERSEDRHSDIHRTSPCDMLPNMKQNWSCVAKFGKELRTKRKKLKSLDVSIESKRRSLEKCGTSSSREEITRPDVAHGKRKDRRRKEAEPKVAEKVFKNTSDKGSVVGKESSVKIEGDRKEQAPLENRKDSSVSNSSFITLDKGEQVRIRNLDSCQLNDIIGILDEDRRAEIEKDMAKKHVPAFDMPPQDPAKMLSEKTPAKPDHEIHERRDADNESSVGKDNLSRTATTGIEEIDESYSTSRLQDSMSNRKRLSLKRRNVDPNLDDSSDSNDEQRLQAVKRDLNREMEQEQEERADVDKENEGRTEERIIEKQGSGYSGGEKRDAREIKGTAKFTSKRQKNAEHNSSLVMFKKLGKIFKYRKNLVPFLYQGSTKKEATFGCPGFGLQLPYNPITILDISLPGNKPATTADYASTSGFGNNAVITVNDTPTIEENSIVEPPKKAEPAAKVKNASSVEPKETTSVSDVDIVFVSLVNENDKTVVQCVERRTPERATKSPRKTTPCKNNDNLLMFSPTEDSQLRFLSLESPTMDTLATQKLIHATELPKDSTPKKGNTSEAAGSSRKRKRSISREMFGGVTKGFEDQDESGCNHSFSSQATCIRNVDKGVTRRTKDSQSDRGQSSIPSTKDIEAVSLTSGSDIITSRRKVYKRILPLGSSDTDSPEIVCTNKLPNDPVNVSLTSKRKRAVSPDSEGEADLNVIVSGWYEEAKLGERCKKKGKLERTRDSSNSMNAAPSCEAKDKAARSCLNDNKPTNKLSAVQRRRPSELAGTSVCKDKCNFDETAWRKHVEILDEDSPDFGASIDKMKDIRNKAVCEGKSFRGESLLQDNFDEIIANVDTEALIDEYDRRKSERESVKPLEMVNREKKFNEGTSSAVYSTSSDKENKCGDMILYVSDDEDGKTLTQENVNAFNKSSSKIPKREEPIESAAKQSTKNPANKSLGKNQMVRNENIKLVEKVHASNQSTVNDTYDQDSLMNITQHYMMMKQFEEDLFGKSKGSNVHLEKEQKTPQKQQKNRGRSGTNEKDVEHSGEEDDIVENTPDTKTKNMQESNSQPESSIASPITDIIGKPPYHSKTPLSTTARSSSSRSTPRGKRKIRPLHQSTPKAQQSIFKSNYGAPKQTVNESSAKETKKPIKFAAAGNQSNSSTSKQSLRFVCSGLLPSQIENVKKLAQIVNAKYMAQFDREVTHVIVKVDEANNGANKTLKYLQGIAHRKWIVSYQWVIDSLKERKLMNEERYEAVDCKTQEAGPRKSRLRTKDLFEGFAFLCIGPYDDVSVEQYQDLLCATGAIVVHSLDALAAEKGKLKVIVIQAEKYEYEIIIEWYKKARAIPIVHDWVVECISQYKLISFYPYLQELSRQDVLVLGYPEYLVEEEPDGDSDSTCDAST